ncbi:MAG: hypothetical protein ACRD3F_03615 [Acidobacteriaceae bacterium]
MPNQPKINVPPPEGPISMNVGQQLTIHAARACNFCCNIGDHFNPDITSLSLSHGDNGPYTAMSTASGTYNSSDPGTTCNPSSIAMTNCKSIQINP